MYKRGNNVVIQTTIPETLYKTIKERGHKFCFLIQYGFNALTTVRQQNEEINILKENIERIQQLLAQQSRRIYELEEKESHVSS